FLFFGFNAVLGLLLFLVETHHLRQVHYSIVWGPWFARFEDIRVARRSLDLNQRKVVGRSVIILGLLVGLMLPGLLPYANAYIIPVEIYPEQNYSATFNFWANPDINGTYSNDPTVANGTPIFPPSVLDALNQSYVNLDLTFGQLTNASIPYLVAWETACPLATYRIVLTPSNGLISLYDDVRNATELMMALESNKTVQNWRGFAFDIEGDPFNYHNNFTSFNDAVALWDKTFDYVANASQVRGKPIEMECICVDSIALDVPLNSTNLQQGYGSPAYTPQRFSTYAPMIYRCGHVGVKPFGSPMDPTHPWETSYSVYSQIELLAQSVPSDTLGVYLGISNCSCYGRDLPQSEPITWGNATGMDNLIRDVLIAKSFGIRQITFFLDFNAIEDGYMMGSVFNSYGTNFLEEMNYWVNLHPPDHFTIYYRASDAKESGVLRSAWIYTFNQPLGLLEMIGLWAGSVLLVARVHYKKNWRQQNAAP
ncbi:MAG TPA: hypothetical protein VKK79_18345, partial [Candidatus Lokiarchaeia archaeon]|nr:hypothetical protein [Candidatus Lokiarchaeia archaeon]